MKKHRLWFKPLARRMLKTCDVYREICLSQLSREEVEKTL